MIMSRCQTRVIERIQLSVERSQRTYLLIHPPPTEIYFGVESVGKAFAAHYPSTNTYFPRRDATRKECSVSRPRRKKRIVVCDSDDDNENKEDNPNAKRTKQTDAPSDRNAVPKGDLMPSLAAVVGQQKRTD